MIQEHQAEDDEDYESDRERKEEEQKSGSQRKSSLPRASKGRPAGSKKASEQEAADKGGFFSRLGDKFSAGLFKASKTTQKSLKK